MNLKLGVIAGDVQNPTKLGLYSDQLNLVYECATEELQVSFKSVEDILTGLENCTTILETIEKHGWHPCMESLLGTTYSQEGLIDMIKNGISKLVEKIKELWNKFVAWVKSFFTSTDAVEKELAEGVKKLEAQKSNEVIASIEANLAKETSNYGVIRSEVMSAYALNQIANNLIMSASAKQKELLAVFDSQGGAWSDAIEQCASVLRAGSYVDIETCTLRDLAYACKNYLKLIPELKNIYHQLEANCKLAEQTIAQFQQKLGTVTTLNEAATAEENKKKISELQEQVAYIQKVMYCEQAVFRYARRNLVALNNKVKSLNLKYYKDR